MTSPSLPSSRDQANSARSYILYFKHDRFYYDTPAKFLNFDLTEDAAATFTHVKFLKQFFLSGG